MKIARIKQQESKTKKGRNISFTAGLTPAIRAEIHQVDIKMVSNRLAKYGIDSDFKDNKTVAWCCEKVVNIFQKINEYGYNLALPKGLFVEDFSNLNLPANKYRMFCNIAPARLKKGSDEVVPPQTIFFNNFETALKSIPANEQWFYKLDSINEIADYEFANKVTSTDSFLYLPLHEFTHIVHKVRLLKKIGSGAFSKIFEQYNDNNRVKEYQTLLGAKTTQICESAVINPFETIACDIPRYIVKALDEKSLLPMRNPFINTPYGNTSFWQLFRRKINVNTDKDVQFDQLLNDFWNGKYNMLRN